VHERDSFDGNGLKELFGLGSFDWNGLKELFGAVSKGGSASGEIPVGIYLLFGYAQLKEIIGKT